MNCTRIPLLFALSLATASAHAQIGIYGKLDLSHYQDNVYNTSKWFYGPGVGVYDNLLHLGPVRAGVDVRGNFLFGDQARFRSIQGGVRVEVKPPLLGIKPYAEGLVGVGGVKTTNTPAPAGITPSYSNKFEYSVLGGVDLTILPRIDWRPVEVGYSRISGTYGASPSTLVNIGTGIVFRLPLL